MTSLKSGTKVRYSRHGVEVEGMILSGPEWFYPDSTVNKYGQGSMGQAVRSYRVRGPIVFANGSIYTLPNGGDAPGIYYVPCNEVEAA